MARSGVPNRWKGLAIGVVGGIAGTIARRYYEQKIAARYFPPTMPPAKMDAGTPDPVEQRAHFAPHYRDDETMMQTAAYAFYERLYGHRPQTAEARTLAEDVGDFIRGMLMGAAYGGTRTTTRARDIAGGFFFGIRLWLGETVVGTLLGLRPGPTRFSPEQHAHLLTSYWVFSFVATNVTRILYRLLSPSDWL
jgi:uncharacterized membrane protein